VAFDFDAIADAIAARYAGIGPPAGYTRAMQSSQADLPQSMGALFLPRTLVFMDQGRYQTGDVEGPASGTRQGAHGATVNFYLRKLTPKGDIARAQQELRAWLGLLVDRHLANARLGGLVEEIHLAGYRITVLDYAGASFAGIQLDTTFTTTEPYLVSAT
jgi:hypothetical protein